MGEGEINEHYLKGKNSKLLEHTNTYHSLYTQWFEQNKCTELLNNSDVRPQFTTDFVFGTLQQLNFYQLSWKDNLMFSILCSNFFG